MEIETDFVAQIKLAIKAVILDALCEGFSETSFLITDHVKYLRKLESSVNPERYIITIGNMLFSDQEAYEKRIQSVHTKYSDTLALKFEELYQLYYTISRERSWRQTLSMPEAEKILDNLLQSY